MTSFYSVIRYVPDPMTGERMNIGLAVFGDGRTRVRFTRDWQRMQSFGGEDAQFLREFAESSLRASSQNLPLPGLEEPVDFSEESLRRVAGKWINSIQFSDVKASLLSPDDLLEDIAARVLRVRHAPRRSYRSRRAAAALASREIAEGLRETVGKDWERFFHKRPELEGRLQSHPFDAAIENGRPLVAARGLSFEGPPTPDLEKEVRITAWALDDIREAGGKIRLAIFALPPTRKSKLFEEATRVFDGLDAEIVLEDQAHEWAITTASKLGVG